MAYRTARGAGRGYSRTRARSRPAGGGYRKAVRTGRRASASRSSRPQTVRIELVGMPASPVSRSPFPQALKPVAPKKAKH